MYDPGQLYLDPILTNFATGWPDQDLYAERLAPTTRVNTQSGRYRVFDRSDWLIYRSRREPGTQANEIFGRKWSEDTFMTEEHSLQAPVYDEEDQQLNSLGGLANPTFGGALQINPEQDATLAVQRSIDLEREMKTSTLFRDTTQYAAGNTTALVGAQQWSDYTYVVPGDPMSVVSDPVGDIRTAVQTVKIKTGRWPNTMTIPFDAVGIIENHPRVVARYQYVSVFDPSAWRQIMGLPPGVAEQLNVFVVDSKYNAAPNLDHAEVITSFWGQDVFIGVVDGNEGMNVKTFAKTFAQTYPSGDLRPVDRWYIIDTKTTKVRQSFKYDLKVVSPDAGYLIQTAVAAI